MFILISYHVYFNLIVYILYLERLYKDKVASFMKANYFILYNYFTEITSGVSTFEGANQSAARNQCWFTDILVAFAILAK